MFIFYNIWYWIFKRKIDRELKEMEETLKKWGIWKCPIVLTVEQKERMKKRLKEYMRQGQNK